MKILLFGPPGCGKGTYSELLKEYGFKHISTGNLLRTTPGKKWDDVRESISKGNLAKPEEIIELLSEYLDAIGDENIVLDGACRTVPEAEWIIKNHTIDLILYIDIKKETCVNRIIKRSKTSGRDDDTEKTARKRYDVYVEQTLPVLNVYKDYKVINGENSIDLVFEEIKNHIISKKIL